MKEKKMIIEPYRCASPLPIIKRLEWLFASTASFMCAKSVCTLSAKTCLFFCPAISICKVSLQEFRVTPGFILCSQEVVLY